ncbi:MAG TPA: 2-amino-4-hydroxy-6-hydroxymethyldihydropteridine diphosphokinase [Candidatus Avimonas sp.]|nr:2-amino-4-hydroxy-6-hydroxymethyldihydropteridine diphosphokinase [Clostridiales bacterium]HPU58063.1 2-amino-4-hydroxy-6-hydroxymethyldihydropteridine diphosphokinase [Candidatus Avimonas sp.]
MKGAVLSLGSNLGDREKNLKDALDSLSRLPGTRIIKKSGIYVTKPVGFTNQPDFLNMAAVVETSLSPRALLGGLLGIEAALGRVRQYKNGPRVIDIDLLVYEGAVFNDDELTLPHPRMHERAFVMVPLSELFSDGMVFGFDFKKQMDLFLAENTGVKKLGL